MSVASSVRTPRSYLYVPGWRADMMAKAEMSGADAVIYDLEDSVPLARKAEARDAVSSFLSQGEAAAAASRFMERWVRLDLGQLEDSVVVAVRANVKGVFVPKAEASVIALVEDALARAELRVGMKRGAVKIIPLVETARGVMEVGRVAASERVQRLGVGAADLSASLGVRYDGVGLGGLRPLLMQIVVVSAACGLDGPICPTSLDFRNLDQLRATTTEMYRSGFMARSCIHPAQLDVVNGVFTPSVAEVHAAQELVEAYHRSLSRGAGVFTDARGMLVDQAVVRQAQRTIARALL